ncbi:MAG: ATP-binding protein [Deltaproteobacteria bacterium]|nr:ATP-binding protein [Deltaproteobacteria bacterium]
MRIQRILDLPTLLTRKSCFLFGPRGTGKSFLIREQLQERALIINLLRAEFFLRLSAAPSQLEDLIDGAGSPPLVVIDEVQKIPLLLDEVHRLIEERAIRFLLTGSSARKLKRGQANLLAGRASHAELFSFTWKELEKFDLHRYLRFGGLPRVYLSEDPEEELDAYVRTYLAEEIQAEGLIRRLPPFSRFLQTAALANGELINFANIASDAQVAPSTVREHYQLLEDTLIGFFLLPWTHSKKRKAISTAKFYFCDTGVAHTLTGTKHLDRNSDLFGRSFAHFLAMELRSALSYQRTRESLSFWRSTHGHEVDFVVGNRFAVEVKAKARVSERDAHGLKALQEEKAVQHYYLVSQDHVERKADGIEYVHWETFLTRLWK